MMLIFNNNNEECENHHEAFGIENRTDASLLYYGLDYLLCRYFCLTFFFPPPSQPRYLLQMWYCLLKLTLWVWSALFSMA